nr:phage tail sheath subtilisin-like domain-containing protein [uncultured Kingella sp.]
MTADRHHGVTAREFTKGTRSISDISTNIIGIIATADDADSQTFPIDTPVFFTSAYAVLGKAGKKGTLARALDGIIDQADAQIIVVRVAQHDDVSEQEKLVIGEAHDNVYTGIKALRRAKAVTGYTPKILGAPGLDSQAVTTELVGVAQATRAFVYAGVGTADTVGGIGDYRANFGAAELMLVDNQFVDGNGSDLATIARILGARAKLDTQTGWHKSISNTEINGVTRLKYARSFDLLDKNCDANTINNTDVTTLIRENGFRVWGNRTCSTDPMLAFEVTVRTKQIIQETIASSFLWAIDKPMHPSLLEDIVMGINAKLAEYVYQGRILGARVFVDKDKNQNTNIGAGQFTFGYEFSAVPPLENMIIEQYVTDTFFVSLTEKVVAFANNLKPATV